MKKCLFFFVLLLCAICFRGNMVYATDSTPTVDAILNNAASETDGAAEDTETSSELSSEASSEDSVSITSEELTDSTTEFDPIGYVNNEFGYHTLDEVGGKVLVKGGEILQLVQIVGYIIVSIVFIIAVIVLAVNKATGSGHSSGLGFGALIICGICYVLIFLGPSILEWLKTWVVS